MIYKSPSLFRTDKNAAGYSFIHPFNKNPYISYYVPRQCIM